MKKSYLFGLIGMLFLFLTACSPKTSSSTPSSHSTTKSTVTTSLLDDTKLSVTDSIKLYQETYPNSDITTLELEETLGQPIYKIEGIDDQNEYEVKINAKTKEVSDKKTEALDTDEQGGSKRDEEKLNLDSLITPQKAAELAQKQFKGTPSEFELSKELNITYWDVKIKEGHQEHSVKINAQSGDILAQEQDD